MTLSNNSILLYLSYLLNKINHSFKFITYWYCSTILSYFLNIKLFVCLKFNKTTYISASLLIKQKYRLVLFKISWFWNWFLSFFPLYCKRKREKMNNATNSAKKNRPNLLLICLHFSQRISYIHFSQNLILSNCIH